MLKLLTIAILGTFLAGCTVAQEAALKSAVGQKQAYNDNEARLFLKAPCAITAGAYFRLSPMDRRAVEALCGGESFPRPSDRTLGQ